MEGFTTGNLNPEQTKLAVAIPRLFAAWKQAWTQAPINLPVALATVGFNLLQGRPPTFVQGVPGAGKTHIAVLIVLWMVFVLDWNIWWLAGTNAPLDAALIIIAQLLQDADSSMQQLVARFPGLKAEQDCPLDPKYVVSVTDRGQRCQKVKCALITTTSFEIDARRQYPSLAHLPDPD